MVAFAHRSPFHSSLADDGFAPHTQAPLVPPSEPIAPPLLIALPEPPPAAQSPWLDDPSYDAAAFLAGL